MSRKIWAAVGVVIVIAYVVVYVVGVYTGAFSFPFAGVSQVDKSPQSQAGTVTENTTITSLHKLHSSAEIGDVYEMRLGYRCSIYECSWGSAEYFYAGDGVLTMVHGTGAAVEFRLKVGAVVILGNSYKFEVIGWDPSTLRMKLLDYQLHMR